MLYEIKRNFGKGNISLKDDVFAVDAVVFAGSAVSATAGTAGAIDFEAPNQQFPDNNTLEIYCLETGASAGEAATVAITLQSSADDGTTWKNHYVSTFAEAALVKDEAIPLQRMTLPGDCGALIRLSIVVGTEVFTAGKLFAVVRPL